jgi:hypothetical protein
MKDKILLFLGSGTSLKSELPNTHEITYNILSEKWYEHTDQNFYPGQHPNEYFRASDITPRVQKFLNILKEFSDSYYRDRRDSDSNYEDLFYLCQQINDNQTFEIDNPVIAPFVNQLHNKLVGLEIYPSIPPIKKRIDIKYLSDRAISLIQSVVWNSLLPQKEPVGLDLILEIIDKFPTVNIATLNHDLLIEKLFEINHIEYCDGFGKPEGQIKYFMPNLYDSDDRIKLFKLHGSLNWYRFREEKNDIIIDKFGMALSNDPSHLRDSNGHFVNVLDGIPLFLTGSYNKMLDYNFGIFRKIHFKFDDALDNTKTIIMSGYGWNDRGINGRIFEWIGSSTENRIILLHERPENLKNYSKSAMWHRYDDLVKTKRLIPIKKWFSDVKYSEIKQFI